MTDRNNDSTHLDVLLSRANAGQTNAFNDLIDYTTDRLRRLARSMLRRYPHVRRWEDTDDLFQATVLRLHRSLEEVRPENARAFMGLAATQVRRALIDLARHYYGVYGQGANHHSQGGGKAADDSGGHLANASTSDGPETLQQWAAFHEAIDALPNEERETFELVWYGGHLQKDVAEMIGVAEKTIVRRMNRARLQLREIMGGDSPLGE